LDGGLAVSAEPGPKPIRKVGRFLRLTAITAASPASRTTMPPAATDQRAPNSLPIHPISGAPTAVPPCRMARYRASTRPRNCGSTESWMLVLQLFRKVMEARPTGIRAVA